MTADFTLRFMWVSLLFITIHLLYTQVSLDPKDTAQIERVIVGKVIYGGDNGW